MFYSWCYSLNLLSPEHFIFPQSPACWVKDLLLFFQDNEGQTALHYGKEAALIQSKMLYAHFQRTIYFQLSFYKHSSATHLSHLSFFPPRSSLLSTVGFNPVTLIPLCWWVCVFVCPMVCMCARAWFCSASVSVYVCVIIAQPPRGNQQWSSDSPDPLMPQHTCPWGAVPPSSVLLCVYVHVCVCILYSCTICPQLGGIEVGMLHHPLPEIHTHTLSRGSPEDEA